jgi:hypothetical protein
MLAAVQVSAPVLVSPTRMTFMDVSQVFDHDNVVNVGLAPG